MELTLALLRSVTKIASVKVIYLLSSKETLSYIMDIIGGFYV